MSETKPDTVASMTAPLTIDLGVHDGNFIQLVVTETSNGACEISSESPAFDLDQGTIEFGFQWIVHAVVTIPAEYRQAVAAAILGASASPEDEP